MSATIETLGLKVNIDGMEAVREATEALNALAAAAVRAETAIAKLSGGQTIEINGAPTEVVGVQGFDPRVRQTVSFVTDADFARAGRNHDQRRA